MELVTDNQNKPNAVQMASPTCLVDSGPKERVYLELGHAYEPRRWASGRAVPENWRVWVRGVAGADISALVDKVVFQLCPDTQFPFPKKICLDPPYQLQEAGSAPKEILVDVHFKCSTKPEILQLKYGSLYAQPDKRSSRSRCIFYEFRNPSEQIRMGLLKSMSSTQCSGSELVVLPDSRKVQSQAQQTAKPEPLTPLLHKRIFKLRGSSIRGLLKRKSEFSEKKMPQKQLKMSKNTEGNHEFVAPINCNLWENMKHPNHTKSEPSIPAGTPLRKRTSKPKPSQCFNFDHSRAALKNALRQESTVKLTEGELEHVSRMCSAQSIHGKSVAALRLPPWSDPLYRLPELPPALRRATHHTDPDHVLQ